jgi:hypothetical protein
MPLSDPPKEAASSTSTYSKPVCEKGSGCSASVSLLTITRRGESNQCMASLVGNDLLVTTSHCLPEELRVAGAKCQGLIRAQFPAVGDFPEVQADCKEVVSASSLYDRARARPDYAFIRLASHLNRPILQFDHSGFENRTAFQMIQTVPALSSSDGIVRMTSQTCYSVQRSIALPGSIHPKSSVVTMTDCTPEPSSEGAPLLDQQGRIRGIIQSLVPQFRILKRIDNQKLLGDKIDAISWATNFACVRFPENDDAFYIPPPCQEDPNEPNDLIEDAQTQALISRCASATDRNYTWPTLPTYLQWGTKAFSSKSREGLELGRTFTTSSDIDAFTIPVPKCLVKDSPLTTFNLMLPMIGYSFALNHSLVLSRDNGRALGSVPVRLEIDSPDFHLESINHFVGRYVNIFVDRAERSGKPPLILRAPLPDCTQ